ncbi:helix-turn-helix domain-containing protein [Nocardioides sp. R1-1]|uniref:helix-turn-helix domain-containing protein n=1 Tax=Nocardioides sp. R1-1 TaxID=3383502 RepID=UPI0038D12DB6
MAAARPITEEELDEIRALHAEGKSCRQIAHEIGRSFSSVSRHCRDMGLKFDTSRVAEATEVRVTANRARRAELETRLLDEAANLLDQLHEPHLIFNWSKENDYAEQELDEPDVAAKATLVRAAGVAIDKAIKLSETDKATAEASAGKSMVGALFGMFAATVPDDPDAEDDDPEDPGE